MLLLLIVTIVRLELDRQGALATWSLLLALVLGALALASSAFVLHAMRRHRVTETELRRSERTFQGILTIAADAIISVDEELRVVHYNHGAEAMFGWSAAEMMGQSLHVLLPPRFRAAHARHVQDFGRGPDVARRMGERQQIFGQRRDGTEFPAEASISKLEVDGVRLYNVVLRDITQRVRAVEAQRFLAGASNDANATLDYEATLIAAVHAPIPYLADCAVLDVVEGSGEVRRVTSVHEDPDLTRVLRQLAGRLPHVPDAPFPTFTALQTDEAVHRLTGPESAVELVALRASALLTIPMRARSRPIGAITLIATDPQRRYDEEAIALAVDLGERLAAAIDNATLYRDERRASQMRDELLGVVSHDLRNPLSAIAMCARVLAEHEPETPARRREVAEAILESVDGMQRLIQDLLDAATIESGHLRLTPEHAPIGSVLLRAVDMVIEPATERGVQVRLDVAAELPELLIDALRMEQVVGNLLGNAVKFTEREGTVTLRAREWEGGVCVEVIDTGIGIPPESLPHIFDRFWHARRSSRTAGTGLGLAIARGIVIAHGGTLEVESVLGQGSTFRVRLPAATGARPAPTG